MSVTCVVEGCERDRCARGWCNVHHRRWRRTGDLRASVPPRRRQRQQPFCAVDGCDETTAGRGWCRKHYDRGTGPAPPTSLHRARRVAPLMTAIAWTFGEMVGVQALFSLVWNG